MSEDHDVIEDLNVQVARIAQKLESHEDLCLERQGHLEVSHKTIFDKIDAAQQAREDLRIENATEHNRILLALLVIFIAAVVNFVLGPLK